MNSTTASPSSSSSPDSPISLGALLGIIFAVAILAQMAVLGCYYCCKKQQQETEHRDRVTTMHNAFMEAVDNEKRLGSENERHGSYAGGGTVNHQHFHQHSEQQMQDSHDQA